MARIELKTPANRRSLAPMGKVVVKIPHIVWRNGQPRFVPGPRLRDLGMKGRDLVHDDGKWVSLLEAQEESRRIEVEARHLQDVRPRKRAVAAVRRAALGQQAAHTVAQAVADYLERSPKSRKWSRDTRRGYELAARQIQEDDAALWAHPVSGLTKGRVRRWADQVELKRGLASARAATAMLRAALNYAVLCDHILVNPALSLGLETPDGRIRVGSPEEMRYLISVADAAGRPEIGDSIAIGLYTGLRQNDRLAMKWTDIQDGVLRMQTSKTRAHVAPPLSAMLLERLAAAQARRKVLRIAGPVLWDETADAPFLADWYRHVFMTIRDKAAEEFKSLSDFRDQDLRDTAVTWLARAGSNTGEICAITGHSEKRAAEILKRHYLGEVPERAAAGAAKLGRWVEEQGGL